MALKRAWTTAFATALLIAAMWGAGATEALAQANKAPAKARIFFAVNEGATTQTAVAELVERYAQVGKVIERTLGQPVHITVYPETARFRAALAGEQFDVIFGKTVNLLAGAVRDKQFQAVVKIKNPYVAGFITRKDSSLRKPEDMRGKTIIMPEKVFTTKLAEATLRELGFRDKDVSIQYTRLQEVVAFSVESGVADVGVVNPTVKRQWQEKGNLVLLETKPVPNWSIIVSRKFSDAEIERLRGALVALKDSPQGVEAMKAIGVTEFVAANNAEYLDLLKYVGG